MIETIDGAIFKDMVINAALKIDDCKQTINELNVFPVPDGDTGTNMSLTMAAAMNALKTTQPGNLSQTAEQSANALLRGARGNSGVILSLLFRGLARGLKGAVDANAATLALAMSEGVTAAYKAVMKPAEGTILTVSRLAAAAACEAAESGGDIEDLFKNAIKAGYQALAETVNQNPVLKKAGVIDAGGKGYMIILEAMYAAVLGDVTYIPVVGTRDELNKDRAVFSEFDAGDITFGYCTEFIVSRENDKDPQLLWEFLGVLGDSIVVVDDDEIIKVHVHTDKPGEVLTEALSYGSLLTIKVENMREQHTETIERERTKTSIAAPEKKSGAVAICAGDGFEAVFRDLGADLLVSGGQTMNPSTENILECINMTPSEIVYVFPNNKNIILAAEQCVGMTPKEVFVMPTASMPQGISAMLVLDPEGEVSENCENMRQAISGVHTVSVTYAARDSLFDGIEIRGGDYLAMLENQILCSGPDSVEVFGKICDLLNGFQPDFVTLFYGSDASEEDARIHADAIAKSLPNAEVSIVNGGQPVYYYIISAE